MILSEVFGEISNPESSKDQRFIDLQFLNKNLRSPCNYSMLDFEEFYLFCLSVNNLYDTDGEISENEFLTFCMPWRKFADHVNKRITINLFALDEASDTRMFEDLLKECDLEYNRKFVNFLDGGVSTDKSYTSLNKKSVVPGETNITQIIRRGEHVDVEGLASNSGDKNQQPQFSASKLPNLDHAVPQTFAKDSQGVVKKNSLTNMYESKAHAYGGKKISLIFD